MWYPWCLLRCYCPPRTIHAFGNDASIAQRSPKMTVLILDACTEFLFDERAVEGSGNNHGLNMTSGSKLKNVRDYVFARACAQNAHAADTGKDHLTREMLCVHVLDFACVQVTATRLPMCCSYVYNLHALCVCVCYARLYLLRLRLFRCRGVQEICHGRTISAWPGCRRVFSWNRS